MKKYIIYIIIFLVSLTLLGGFFVTLRGETSVSTDSGSEKDQWLNQLKKFSEIYSLVKQHYPGKVDEEKVIYASISGILRVLDPHSYFLDPTSMRTLNEDQQGNYYGIGTRITKYEDRLTVVAPLAGTPAYKLGIMAGDVIAEIEGEETRAMSLDDAMKKLRGAKDTYVNIKIKRDGLAELIPYRIKRAEIPLTTVSYSLPHPDVPEIGYISVRTFGTTTAREIEESLKKLVEEDNVKALILDLRGNAGGALIAAIDVSDLFLEKGKTIVSIQGRAFRQGYKAKKDDQFEKIPLTVLINRGSASASEIVAAALQDHKRATIIGTRSWGKGLVQSISPLALNSAVALTTAKYYTPENKCIQRDFNERDDYYFFLNNKNYDTDTSIIGGVIPDVTIKSGVYPGPIVPLISKGVFFKFARHLASSGMKITREFVADEGVIKEFKKFLENYNTGNDDSITAKNQDGKKDRDNEQSVKSTENVKDEPVEKNEEKNKEKNKDKKKEKNKLNFDTALVKKYHDTIKDEIEREVLSHKFSQTEGMKVFLRSDPVTRKAVESLKKIIKKN